MKRVEVKGRHEITGEEVVSVWEMAGNQLLIDGQKVDMQSFEEALNELGLSLGTELLHPPRKTSGIRNAFTQN